MNDKEDYPDASSQERLRDIARDLLDHGVTPSHHGGSLGVDALQLLYERASAPETAADAVKLLHELQTYQVELDLLYEQLQANEHEVSEELAHYKALYELAPVAYLTVANDGEIIEGNQAAGALFGQPPTELSGRPLCAFLAPDEDVVFRSLLDKVGRQDQAMASFGLPDGRHVRITARTAEAGDSILMILMEATAVSTALFTNPSAKP